MQLSQCSVHKPFDAQGLLLSLFLTLAHTRTRIYSLLNIWLYFAYTMASNNLRINELFPLTLTCSFSNTKVAFSVQQNWHFYIGLLHRWISWFLTNQTAIQTFFFYASTALVDLGLLSFEVSRTHSDVQYSVELLWTRDQPVAETSTWQNTHFIRNIHLCPPPVGFEPAYQQVSGRIWCY